MLKRALNFQALIKDSDKQVLLIRDDIKVHHRKLVKSRAEKSKEQRAKIKASFFHLTSYSPRLNPEEPLSADLRRETGKRIAIRTRARYAKQPTMTWRCWGKLPNA